MSPSFSEPRVVIRPALPLDRPAVLEFCKFIWDGHDYIPYVWDDWMADPSGQMFVAEYAGQAVGLGRLTHLAPGQWWLEGLRVDPAHQDRKIGSLLNDYLNAEWLERGDGLLRLMTSSKRVKVHHMCEQHGYTRIQERAFFMADPLAEQAARSAFVPAGAADIPAAVEFALAAGSSALTGPLVDAGWRFATPSEALFRSYLGREATHLYWWHERSGLLLTVEDDWDEGRFLIASVIACAAQDLPGMLRDLRALAAKGNFYATGWSANLKPELVAALTGAGFRREDEGSAYLFEKRHPTRP